MRIKDILKLRQKEAISGEERIPVSKDEYVTIDQINEEVKKVSKKHCRTASKNPTA